MSTHSYLSHKKIAIVGGGAAGVTFAYFFVNSLIAQSFSEPIQIRLFEPHGIGEGVAYQHDHEHLILNVRAQDMSIDHGHRNDFFDWCKKLITKNPALADVVEDESYPPRYFFGMYLKDVFDSVQQLAAQNKIDLQHINDEVIDLDKINGHYQLTSSSGEKNIFDIVSLCTGHFKTSHIYNLNDSKNYISHPYPLKNSLKNIPSRSKIAILGSGLTAIDIVIALLKNQHQGYIHMHSRNGGFPSIRGRIIPHHMRFLNKNSLNKLIEINNGYVKLIDIFKLLCKEFFHVGEKLKKVFTLNNSSNNIVEFLNKEIHSSDQFNQWQSILMATNEIVEEYWHALREEDKEFFLKKYHTIWLMRRVPIPKINALYIQSIVNSGQLLMKKGISSVEVVDQGFVITNTDNQKENYEIVINAAGLNRDAHTNSDSLLLRNLLQKGYVIKNPHGGINVDFDTACILDKNKKRDSFFCAVGQLTQGVYYYTASYPMLARKISKVAGRMASLIRSIQLNAINHY
jgi:uncharacterized NAD(P)/FAD-binding protein YdhS